MKKQTKLISVMSTAAFMALNPFFIGKSYLIYAAESDHTSLQESTLYYNEDGEILTDTWYKNGNDWFYLNEQGEISINQKIDDYYVGNDGKMVKERWISIAEESDSDMPEAPNSFWYYFDQNGKAIISNWLKQDDQWFYFNEDGHMVTGKVSIDDANYYFGSENDGVMKTGWIKLEENSSNPDAASNWYYANANGKLAETQYDKKIDHDYYTFIDGKMQTGWVKMPKDNSAETTDRISDFQYYDSVSGKRAEGWYSIEGINGIHQPEEIYSFFFQGGKAIFSSSEGNELFTINGKKYAFNENGEMQTGKQIINLPNGEIANFYFGDDGIMKTGKQSIYNEINGETEIWFFHMDGDKKGQGFHGIRDNTLYVYGKRQEAASDLKYAPAVLNETSYLVNTNGSIQKAVSSSYSTENPELGRGYKDYRDLNGKIWIVDQNGMIQ